MALNKKKSLKTKKNFFSNKKKRNSRRSKKQQLWKMRGCSNMSGGCGCQLMNGGGSCSGSMLAYPYNNLSCVNNLAYTGNVRGGGKKGGKKGGNGVNGVNDDGVQDPPSGNGVGIEKIITTLPVGGHLVGGTSVDNMPMGAKYPSGTVGSPWGPSYSNWPGVNGIQGDRNYYILNPYNNQPDYSPSIQERTTPAMSTGGSRKYGKAKKNKKTKTFRKYSRKYVAMNKRNKVGGWPQLNIMTDVKNAYNTLKGNPQTVSPLPFEGQLTKTQNCYNSSL